MIAFNAIALAGGILVALTEHFEAGGVITIVALMNIFLRFLTNKPIKFI